MNVQEMWISMARNLKNILPSQDGSNMIKPRPIFHGLRLQGGKFKPRNIADLKTCARYSKHFKD